MLNTKEERNQNIIAQYKAGMTLKDIGRDNGGLSSVMVGRIVKSYGLGPEDRNRVSTRLGEKNKNPISDIHERLGRRILHVRTFKRDMSPKPFAELIGVSVQTLSRIERGVYDISVSELDLICNVIGLEIHELVSEAAMIT
ncbi:helix-turn-helix domain-containing protein [Kiloniella sp.]|uniref:helix-turn-helix domain-containing protein n=1 Tax=Kiloniella sp. TaxID=1938587 RepID=UPI003B012650